MKKFIILCAILFSWALHADTAVNQLNQFDFFLCPFKRGMEICKEKGFTHFLVKKITYEDQYGQSLVFKGLSDSKADAVISETITKKFDPPLGTLTVECELLFFKNEPLAIDSSKYLLHFLNPVRKSSVLKEEATTIKKTQSLEESLQMTQAIAFTDPLEDSIALDQLTQFACALMLPFRTILPRTFVHSSKYFLVKKIAYRDERGQSFVFNGVPDVEGGLLVVDTTTEEYEPPVGTITVESEIFYFDNLPSQPLVVDILKWLKKDQTTD